MQVVNINGTGELKPKDFKTWIEYWISQKGYNPISCSNKNCTNKVPQTIMGAHVKKVYGYDQKWYIVPLCEKCNPKSDFITIDEDKLVPVPSNL